MSSSADTNGGIEISADVMPDVPRSKPEFARYAEMMPSGTAISSAIPIDSTAISIVTGRRAAISDATLVLGRITELPRSPCRTSPSQLK